MATTPRGRVFLNLEIYKTVIATTVRYANSRIPEQEWAEVYGLLYGYTKNDDVYITEAIPFTHTKKQRHILKVEFDEEDYILAADIETEYYIRDPPQFCVGWYHSHPGIKLMLSQDDVKNQLAWQTNNPLAIALVFNHVRLVKQVEVAARKGDPIKQLPLDPGFLIFRLDDPSRGIEAAFHEVPFGFTDYAMDEPFVHNAQEFVQWVTKAFPRGEGVLTEYRNYINTTVQKINEIFFGTQNYIQTLQRKGETARIPGVIETQKETAKKILQQGNTMIDIFRMMRNYLEYKERAAMVSQIDDILKNWEEGTVGYLDRFDNVASSSGNPRS